MLTVVCIRTRPFSSCPPRYTLHLISRPAISQPLDEAHWPDVFRRVVRLEAGVREVNKIRPLALPGLYTFIRTLERFSDPAVTFHVIGACTHREGRAGNQQLAPPRRHYGPSNGLGGKGETDRSRMRPLHPFYLHSRSSFQVQVSGFATHPLILPAGAQFAPTSNNLLGVSRLDIEPTLDKFQPSYRST